MKYFQILLFCSLLLTTCIDQPAKDIEAPDINGIQAICIIDETPLRTDPAPESELITTLFLGDEFRYLGESKTVLQTEYMKIELFDGTHGWLPKEAVLFNAEHAAVIRETILYPELDSRDSPKITLYPTEYVAIVRQDGDWVKVVGANREKGGWMKTENLSTSEDNIFIATLAHSDLLDNEGEIIRDKLPSFIHSLPDKNAMLALYLQEVLENEVADAIAESIMEYEMGFDETDESSKD